MSKDIKIVEREIQDTRLLSREEREARLKEAATVTKLPKYHFENFLELDESVLANENKHSKPVILELLLRKLLSYEAIIPIVAEKINKLKSMADVNNYFDIPTLRAFGSNEDLLTGGTVKNKTKKPKESFNKTELKKESSNNINLVSTTHEKILPEIPNKTNKLSDKALNSVSVQINGVKKFIHLSDVGLYVPGQEKFLYQTSNNETIQVVGIFIDHTAPLIRYFRDKYPWSMNAIVAIMTGTYTTQYLHNRLFSPVHIVDEQLFMKNLQNYVPGLITVENADRMYYLFNADNTKHICESLFEYLIYLEKTLTLQQSIIINNAFTRAEEIAGNESVSEQISDSASKSSPKLTLQKIKRNVPKFSELFKLMAVMITKFYTLPTGVVQSEIKIEIDLRIGELLTQLQPYMSRKRSVKYESSLRYDLWINNMFELFEKFYVSLEGDVDVRKQFAKELKELLLLKASEEHISAEMYVRQQREFTSMFAEMRYRWIYIQKFGWDKFVTLYSAPIGKYEWKNMRLAPIMTLLPKNVRDIVEVEYKRIEKYTDALYNNNCPHIKIETAMRSTEVIVERHKAYNELKKYIPDNERKLSNGTPYEMITCLSCKFPLICPHIRDLYELENNKRSDDEIREFINKYSGNAPVDRYYYCRICGEPISDSTELDIVVSFAKGTEPDYQYADNELREYIWQEASTLVRGFTEFKGVQTNKFINKFVGTIVNNVYEFVAAIEKKIIKAKTSSLEDINNKRKLYIIIYVIAFLVKVIGDNPDRIRFAIKNTNGKQSKGIEGSFSKESIGKLLGYAFKIVVGTQNILISRIEGMSDVVIQNSLLKAYKVITTLLTGKSAVPQINEEEIITTLLLDPLFWYIVDAGIRTKMVGIMSKPSVTIFKKLRDSYFDPKVSLGRDIKTMEKSSYVFEGINEPVFAKEDSDAFLKLVETKTTNKEVFEENGLYTGYWIKSFQHVFEYIHSRIYTYPLWKVDIISTPVDNIIEESLRIEINKPYAEYFEKYEKLAYAERILFDLILYEKMRTLHKLPFYKYRDFGLDKNPNITLALAYGNELNKKFPFKLGIEEPKKVGFHMHKWDLIMYSVGNSKSALRKVFSIKDINKKIEQEATSNDIWYVEDVYCSICFYGKSTIVEDFKKEKIDVISIIEEQQQIESFYNFYASQCPYYSDRGSKTGDTIHEFVENVCKNCGYEKSFSTDKNTYKNTYYKQWLATFKKDLALENEQLIHLEKIYNIQGYDSQKIVEVPKSISNPKIGDDIKQWKYNPNIVTELANTFWDINKFKTFKKNSFYNALVNLGLTQDLNYDDILSGKLNPYREMNYGLAKRRETQVSTYIHKLMVDYNIMRNYKNIPSISSDMKEIISSASLVKVLDKLPHFTPDFITGYTQMKRMYFVESDAIKLANWILEFLCKTLLRIYKSAKETAPFIVHFIREILETEKEISKPKENKMAQVLANTKSEEITSFEDQPISDAFNTVSKRDAEPIGYEDMDYDGHNDKIGEGNADDISV